jgi:ribonuclease HII
VDNKEEQARLLKLYDFERKLKQKGYALIAGVDEAGRGPLAGPVVAAAVILDLDIQINDLKDSKKISEKKREKVYEDIKKKAIAYAYDVIDVNYIDNYNILNSTLMAMKNAVEKLSMKPDYILVSSRDSSKVIDGSIVGIRLAIMVLPEPGEPIIIAL